MALTANLTPSKTSGVAPFAVFFDGTGTTCDEVSEERFGGVFHQVLADFDYGDDATASWPYWADVETAETSGTMYAVITTSTTPPSAAQIAAGNDHADVTAHDSWSVNLSAAGHYEHEVRDMAAGTTYYLYYVHDSGGATYGDVTTGLSRVPRSKNYDTGVALLGYHLFDEPGTYTVTMTARAAKRLVGITTVEITVTDPDAVYATTDTICVSAVADYTGAPAGATTQTTVPDAAGLVNKRILFRRGESFTIPKQQLGAQNTQFGVFGPEGDGYADVTYTPQVNTDGNTNGNWATDFAFLEGIRFASVGSDFGVRNVIFYRVKIGLPDQDVGGLISFGNLAEFGGRKAGSDALAAHMFLPRNIFIHECHMAPDEGYISTNIIAYLFWTDSVIAGCYSNRNATQTWRTVRGYKCIYQDNRLPGKIPGNLRNILKNQAAGPEVHTYTPVRNAAITYGEGENPWRGHYETRYMVIRNNDMCGEMTSQAQPISASGQHSQFNGLWNNTVPNKISDVVIENNYIRLDSQFRTLCTGAGTDLTMRRTVMNAGNTEGTTAWSTAAVRLHDVQSYVNRGKNFAYNVDSLAQDFQVGEIVTGQSTGSTAEVEDTSNGGLTVNFRKGSGGRATNGNGRGTALGMFADDEIITGSLGGEATINAPTVPPHYYVISEEAEFLGPYHEYSLEDDDTPPGISCASFMGGNL